MGACCPGETVGGFFGGDGSGPLWNEVLYGSDPALCLHSSAARARVYLKPKQCPPLLRRFFGALTAPSSGRNTNGGKNGNDPFHDSKTSLGDDQSKQYLVNLNYVPIAGDWKVKDAGAWMLRCDFLTVEGVASPEHMDEAKMNAAAAEDEELTGLLTETLLHELQHHIEENFIHKMTEEKEAVKKRELDLIAMRALNDARSAKRKSAAKLRGSKAKGFALPASGFDSVAGDGETHELTSKEQDRLHELLDALALDLTEDEIRERCRVTWAIGPLPFVNHETIQQVLLETRPLVLRGLIYFKRTSKKNKDYEKFLGDEQEVVVTFVEHKAEASEVTDILCELIEGGSNNGDTRTTRKKKGSSGSDGLARDEEDEGIAAKLPLTEYDSACLSFEFHLVDFFFEATIYFMGRYSPHLCPFGHVFYEGKLALAPYGRASQILEEQQKIGCTLGSVLSGMLHTQTALCRLVLTDFGWALQCRPRETEPWRVRASQADTTGDDGNGNGNGSKNGANGNGGNGSSRGSPRKGENGSGDQAAGTADQAVVDPFPLSSIIFWPLLFFPEVSRAEQQRIDEAGEKLKAAQQALAQNSNNPQEGRGVESLENGSKEGDGNTSVLSVSSPMTGSPLARSPSHASLPVGNGFSSAGPASPQPNPAQQSPGASGSASNPKDKDKTDGASGGQPTSTGDDATSGANDSKNKDAEDKDKAAIKLIPSPMFDTGHYPTPLYGGNVQELRKRSGPETEEEANAIARHLLWQDGKGNDAGSILSRATSRESGLLAESLPDGEVELPDGGEHQDPNNAEGNATTTDADVVVDPDVVLQEATLREQGWIPNVVRGPHGITLSQSGIRGSVDNRLVSFIAQASDIEGDASLASCCVPLHQLQVVTKVQHSTKDQVRVDFQILNVETGALDLLTFEGGAQRNPCSTTDTTTSGKRTGEINAEEDAEAKEGEEGGKDGETAAAEGGGGEGAKHAGDPNAKQYIKADVVTRTTSKDQAGGTSSSPLGGAGESPTASSKAAARVVVESPVAVPGSPRAAKLTAMLSLMKVKQSQGTNSRASLSAARDERLGTMNQVASANKASFLVKKLMAIRERKEDLQAAEDNETEKRERAKKMLLSRVRGIKNSVSLLETFKKDKETSPGGGEDGTTGEGGIPMIPDMEDNVYKQKMRRMSDADLLAEGTSSSEERERVGREMLNEQDLTGTGVEEGTMDTPVASSRNPYFSSTLQPAQPRRVSSTASSIIGQDHDAQGQVEVEEDDSASPVEHDDDEPGHLQRRQIEHLERNAARAKRREERKKQRYEEKRLEMERDLKIAFRRRKRRVKDKEMEFKKNAEAVKAAFAAMAKEDRDRVVREFEQEEKARVEAEKKRKAEEERMAAKIEEEKLTGVSRHDAEAPPANMTFAGKTLASFFSPNRKNKAGSPGGGGGILKAVKGNRAIGMFSPKSKAAASTVGEGPEEEKAASAAPKRPSAQSVAAVESPEMIQKRERLEDEERQNRIAEQQDNAKREDLFSRMLEKERSNVIPSGRR
ncbi:unnamed protein product [Amoebophrya sp. A25]|nr:unnamed protein product [Amoebophrya sp. A25]|eukprot:GSA25T00001298001.1